MAATSERKIFTPQAYDASDYSYYAITNPTNPVGKGSDNTTSATIEANMGSGGVAYTRWPFDCSSIPVGATINSVLCEATASVSTTTSSRVSKKTLQLYSGTSAKGSATTIDSTSRKVYELSCGTWSRDELQRCNLYVYLLRGSSNLYAALRVDFYGADLTVTYTYQSEKFMLKVGGSWAGASRVFKKVSGIWVEQTELANVIEENVRFQNGGEYIAPVKPAAVTITGTGNATYCYATINGTKYNSATSNIEVMPGDVITFGVYGRSSTYYGRVTIDGTQTINVTNQQTQTYSWTVPDGVKTISISMTYTSTSTRRNGRITVTTTSGGSGGSGGANLISFTIDGDDYSYGKTTYYAEQGMNWREWVNSDYNTGYYNGSKFAISSSYNWVYITLPMSDFHIYDSNYDDAVSGDDTIIANYTYPIG